MVGFMLATDPSRTLSLYYTVKTTKLQVEDRNIGILTLYISIRHEFHRSILPFNTPPFSDNDRGEGTKMRAPQWSSKNVKTATPVAPNPFCCAPALNWCVSENAHHHRLSPLGYRWSPGKQIRVVETIRIFFPFFVSPYKVFKWVLLKHRT